MEHYHKYPKSLFFIFEIERQDEGQDRDKFIQSVRKRATDIFGKSLLSSAYDEMDPLGAQACWTCGGDPDSHPSGGPCVCQDGSHESEVAHLRALAYKNSSTNQAIQENLSKRQDERKFNILIEVDASKAKPPVLTPEHIFDKLWHQDEVAKLASFFYENYGISLLLRLLASDADPSPKEPKKGEGEREKTKDMDEATQQWSPQFLRGWLIDHLSQPWHAGRDTLSASSDNWDIMQAVRLEGYHWRKIVHQIQSMLGIEFEDRNDVVDAVRLRLQEGVLPLQDRIRQLEHENARLRGVIEGMEKR